LDLKVVQIDKPVDLNVILGQSHFIKTVEDLHEALVSSVPGIRFGLAFCESSGPCLVRASGNDDGLVELAKKNAFEIGAGHCFIVFLREAYPINVLNAVKSVQEVCTIYCASANPVQVLLIETEQGRGILGVVDGFRSEGVEGPVETQERRELLRRFGYKL